MAQVRDESHQPLFLKGPSCGASAPPCQVPSSFSSQLSETSVWPELRADSPGLIPKRKSWRPQFSHWPLAAQNCMALLLDTHVAKANVHQGSFSSRGKMAEASSVQSLWCPCLSSPLRGSAPEPHCPLCLANPKASWGSSFVFICSRAAVPAKDRLFQQTASSFPKVHPSKNPSPNLAGHLPRAHWGLCGEAELSCLVQLSWKPQADQSTSRQQGREAFTLTPLNVRSQCVLAFPSKTPPDGFT